MIEQIDKLFNISLRDQSLKLWKLNICLPTPFISNRQIETDSSESYKTIPPTRHIGPCDFRVCNPASSLSDQISVSDILQRGEGRELQL